MTGKLQGWIGSLVMGVLTFSPYVLPGVPTTVAAPSCAWMNTSLTPDDRAQALLEGSTLDQKLRWLVEQPANNPTQTTFTVPPFLGGGSSTYPAQVQCTPLIQYTDGPWAVDSGATGITAFPVPVAQTASWDTGLSYSKGVAQGSEAFQKHRNVVLGPGINLARLPFNGRNSEYMGEDPMLAGILAAQWVTGMQTGNPDQPVEAILKHYLLNDQELDRETSSSNIDSRTLHELYGLAFAIAVAKGHPAGVMCSYNQINGVYACENPLTLNQELKKEDRFKGFVVSDFGAVHSTAPSLNAGLDQELNAPQFYAPDKLKAALAAGQITLAQVDEAAFRVVRAHIAAGLFDHALPAAEAPGSVSSPADKAVALRMAEEGTVLLKNDHHILPINRHSTKIAVIGPTASNTPTDGISAASVCSAMGFFDPTAVDCSGTVAPLDSITARAAENGDTVAFNNGSDTHAAASAAASADVAIVFGYYREGEGADRTNINLDGNGDALISAVATANPNTIVILETGSAVLMPWLNQVKGVFEAWYPGQEQGPALAALLFGDVNPSGKLPVSFPKSIADLPTSTADNSRYPGIADANGIRQYSYSEGLKIGYRWYESQRIQPLFAFGYGLSYTTFKADNLSVTPKSVHDEQSIRVRFRLKNTGSHAGTQVEQVYLTLPASAGEPSKRLVGWARVTIDPGDSEDAVVTIDPSASNHPFSYWSTSMNTWTTPSGTFTISIGSSVNSIEQTASITMRGSESRDNGQG